MQTSVAMTDVGRVRKVNQDYVYASDTPVGNLPNLYIVADGMGGHKAGDLASSYAVQTIVEAISRSVETRPALILQKAIRYANYRLYEKSEEREEYHGMGTTLVVLTVSETVGCMRSRRSRSGRSQKIIPWWRSWCEREN